MCAAIIIEAVIVYIMNYRCSDVAIIRTIISICCISMHISVRYILGNFGMGKIVKFDKIVSFSIFYLPIIKYKIIELLQYETLILWNT